MEIVDLRFKKKVKGVFSNIIKFVRKKYLLGNLSFVEIYKVGKEMRLLWRF